MPLRIELPDDLVHDLEQEVARQHLSLAEVIRQALRVWKAGREAPEDDRERVIRVLRERGLLCQLPKELVAHEQPLTAEELDGLALRAAQGGPVSELIVSERRSEV
jgi:Arc/MetJ-type ribon-helix-helix transcriptional regulator